IRTDLARQRSFELLRQISQNMATDWTIYRQAVRESSGAPTTLPNSPSGVPYNSPAYLVRLAERIQGRKESYGVLPHTVIMGELMNEKELATIPGLGDARVNGVFPFVSFVMERYEGFMSPEQLQELTRRREQAVALFQPSLPLVDDQNNFYI